MSFNQVDIELPSDFNNIVRLFPLPNLVLFPGVIQALHLFEPRYRQLMQDALAADELITMALIQTQRPAALACCPELCPTVCIGKILTHAELEDGRVNLLLVGARRAKIVRELDNDTPYRMAEIEVCQCSVDCDGTTQHNYRTELVERFREAMANRDEFDSDLIDHFLDPKIPLGRLIDLVCYSSGAQPEEQQAVLETVELSRRAELVLSILEKQNREAYPANSSGNDFPPGFSLN